MLSTSTVIAHGDEVPSRATVFRWLTEFRCNRNFLLDEEQTGRSLSAEIPENMTAIQNMLIVGKRCTYQMT